MAGSNIGVEDMVFHFLFIGATGSGKTNALLYWLERLSRDRKDVALVLIDPHGDAAIDLVPAIPKAESEGVTILDPTYVSFGLNPLLLPQGVKGEMEEKYGGAEEATDLVYKSFYKMVTETGEWDWN